MSLLKACWLTYTDSNVLNVLKRVQSFCGLQKTHPPYWKSWKHNYLFRFLGNAHIYGSILYMCLKIWETIGSRF